MIAFLIAFFLTTAISTTQPKTARHTVDDIILLLQSGAGHDYIGEPVSQLEHALQCAQLARNDQADEQTIIAALLHDVGHLLQSDMQMGEYGVKYHETLGAHYALDCGLPQKVASLIEGHVQAKRYLTYKNPDYFNKLSYASLQTLAFQCGPMSQEEAEVFERDPLFKEKLQMRSWDEQAKRVGWQVTPLEDYREMLLRNVSIKNL
jgi:2-amino-1-hydroxyethylphosphonate dioxygenase (glycine-forming)